MDIHEGDIVHYQRFEASEKGIGTVLSIRKMFRGSATHYRIQPDPVVNYAGQEMELSPINVYNQQVWRLSPIELLVRETRKVFNA